MNSVFILLVIFLFFAVLVPILAIIDLLGKEFSGNNKIIWILVILFFPLAGSLLYFIFNRGEKNF
mgnify:CR=1 FL=1